MKMRLLSMAVLVVVFTLVFSLISFPVLAQPPDYYITDLGIVGSDWSRVSGMNDSGQVVGWAKDASGYDHAFLWQNGSMQDLGTLGGNRSYAHYINNSGQVVGSAEDASGNLHAFLWESGSMQDLGTLGGDYSSASGINNSGQVVGWAKDASGYDHAFLWQNGSGMQDLGTLGGNRSWVSGINDSGQVVGWAEDASGYYHAFLWQSGSSMQDLGTLGGDYSSAHGINNSGQVVGSAENAAWSDQAFLWENGTMYELNMLVRKPIEMAGWILVDAYAINNSSQIVGLAIDPREGQEEHVYLLTVAPQSLTVVPEPVSSVLFVIGGTTFAVKAYLRRKRRYSETPRLQGGAS